MSRITVERKKKSMIVPHPLWEEKKVTKKDKEAYKKQTGLELKSMVVAKKEWYKLIERLWVGGK